MRIRTLIALALCCLMPPRANAVQMQISNISDFNLPDWSISDNDINEFINVCIYGFNALPPQLSYAITVSSSPSNYRITNGSSYISYTLHWSDALGLLGTQLSDGVKKSGLLNLNVLSQNCLGLPNARLTLTITKAAMMAAPAGTYSGTITLLLSPN